MRDNDFDKNQHRISRLLHPCIMMLEIPTINKQFFDWLNPALIQNLICHCQAIAFSTLLVAHAFKLLLDSNQTLLKHRDTIETLLPSCWPCQIMQSKKKIRNNLFLPYLQEEQFRWVPSYRLCSGAVNPSWAMQVHLGVRLNAGKDVQSNTREGLFKCCFKYEGW